MTRLMSNIYIQRFNNILKSISSVSQFAENRLMRNSLCRLVAVLLLSTGVFSYAQAAYEGATVTIQGTEHTVTDGKITVDGVEYEVWDGTYDMPANGTRNPNQLQLGNYFAGGSGTEADPYRIETAKQFATLGYLAAYVFTGGSNHYGYFRLDADVCIGSYQWPFGNSRGQCFQANLDGNGHTVMGLFVHAQSSDPAVNGQYRYGLFSGIRGVNATKHAVVKNLQIKKPTLYVSGSHASGDHMFGILAGNVHAYVTFENIKIVDPLVDIRASQQSNWYVSTGIAYSQNNVGMRVNNIVVKNPIARGVGELTYRTANSNVRFFFGGVVGYMYSGNNNASTVSTADNCSVTGADIDFSAFTPDVSGNLAKNLFTVGGVIGVSCDPHKYPENLYFSGKIKAPYAIVAPCVGSTRDNDLKYDYVANYYSGEVEGNTDEVERSASSSWHYGDYKIGLSSDFTSTVEENGYFGTPGNVNCRYLNFSSSAVDGNNYLTVTPENFIRHNRFKGTPRRSSTVLWWSDVSNTNATSENNTTDWRLGSQVMYPEFTKNEAVFPSYYMYYAQGVNRDTKYLSTDGGASSVASKYETAAEKNVENAMGASGAKDITLTLTDNNKGQRGFDAHEFEVAATGDDASNLTYQWYVDGVAQGTGTTQSVTPSFNYTQGYQNGVSVIVQALDGSSNILAQAVGYLPVARLDFKGSESVGTKTTGVHTYTYDAGTKEHPYLIKDEKDLRLMSEQMKQTTSMRQEFIHFSSGLNNGNACYYRDMVQNVATNSQISYNQAYYELAANITLNTSYNFTPIGPISYPLYHSDGNHGTYNNNFTFAGVFDGKGYKISGLRQTWSAGYANENVNSVWGLFSCIGSPTQYYKVGGTTATNAAVRNLIIDDAVFTHKTDNTSFYYNNGSATSKANNCYIGPLAGIAGNYSTIENISVTNSKITDEGSSTYKLAAKRLSIGGVVGRATAGITNDNGTLANAEMRYLSSDADIDIQYAEFNATNNASAMQQFNVGGIIGSLHSNATQNTVPFPRPSVYTGRIRARNATVGPNFGHVTWSGFNTYNYRMIAAHWTGKTTPTATFDATGMYYSNFDIYTESTKRNYSGTNYTAGYKRITDAYPSVTSNFGDRNIKEKPSFPDPNSGTNSDVTAGNYASDGEMYEYQGVNEGIFAEASSTEVTDAFNDYSTLTDDQQLLIKDYKWNWSSDTGSNVGGLRPIVTIGEVSGLFVVAKDTYTGTSLTEDHVLTATVNSASTETRYYQWYKKVRVADVDQDVAIDGATAASYTATPNIHNQYIFCRATIGESHADSEVLLIPKTDEITASADKTGSEGAWTMQAKLSLSPTTSATATTLTDAGFEVTYQWYKGSVSNATKSTETGNTTAELSVTTEETTVRYCVITVVDKTAHSDYTDANTWQFTVSKLPANVMVIYLDPSNSTGSANDVNDGKDKDHPVVSWHKAYSQLVDDVTWDDNVIVLMSNSDYDRTKEGFMLDESLTGGNTGFYYQWYKKVWTDTDSQSGLANSNMWKNVTITGKWDDITYPNAQISFGTSENHGLGLFGDTKFQYLTFDGTDGRYHIIYCQYHNLEMGEGIITKGMRNDTDYGQVEGARDLDFQIFGGFLNDRRFRDGTNGFRYDIMEGNITNDATFTAAAYGAANGRPWMPHGKEGFNITVKSGHYSVICSSFRQNTNDGQGIIGTPNMPVRCSINIDIDRTFNDAHKTCIGASSDTNADYDVGLILAGNHEGAMYGNVDINVYSGYVGRIASGTLGALRTNVANWSTSKQGYLPLNAFMGRANILIDPSQSRFAAADETAEVKNARVLITEMYGGGVGRALSSDGMITIPFYGHTFITMNGGTFDRIQSYTPDAKKPLFPGIYATGAGGVNGMYHVAEGMGDGANLSNQRLPYWATNSSGLVNYGDWNTFNAHRGAQKVYIKCYEDFDVAGDTLRYTLIDPEDAQTIVTLNDGVFGTAEKPLDGIYGGGSGYTPTVWLANTSSSYPNYRSGNIYGKPGADHPAATLTINGGDFYLQNGVFAGGRGTDYYYNTKRASNNASNYTTLGQIFGDVELNITGGHFHHDTSGAAAYKGDVYGAGLGVGTVELANSGAGNGTKGNSGTYTYLTDMARIYGTTKVNITGGIIEGSVYGGGAMGDVGYGTASRESETYEIGTKNAVTVKIENATVGGDIFAGSLKSDIYGSTVTTIDDTEIGGDIFGGGNGELDGSGNVTASADIKGNTTVTLGAGSYFIKREGSNFVADYDMDHFVYGGGNLASVIGIYNNSSDAEITDIEGADMATDAKSAKSGGNTTVNINNGVGTGQLSVYGAGLGANTYCNMTNVNINNFATTKTVESVTKVIGLKDVFGGGNKGVVFTNTSVAMRGGQVLGDVFGGGNLAAVGTLAPASYVVADNVGYGNYGTTVALNSNNATVWGNIYGGGNQAAVGGLAQVNLTLGRFAGEVFGGGRGYMTNDNTVGARADINGQTKVYVNGAKTIWNTLWDDSNKKFVTWLGGLTDTNWARFIDKSGTYPKFLNNHNIYGGGYLACTVTDSTRVEVTNGAVPADLIKLDVWKNSFRDNANPHFYVFGGGYGAFTQVANTDVTVGVEGYFSDDEDESTNQQWSLDLPFEGENRETVAGDSGEMGIYGNGYGIGGYTVLGVIGGGYAGLVKNNTNVKLGGTTFVHRVYGGGYGQKAAYDALAAGTNITEDIAGYTSRTRENLGEVGGNTRVLVSLSKPDAKGRTGGVYGDVFGGGAGVDPSNTSGSITDYVDMGKVLGTTHVDVIENARVYGNVYGGGDVGSVANSVNTTDSVTVVKVRGGDVFGSIFGGGKGRLKSQAEEESLQHTYDDLGNVFGNTYVIVRDSVATETIDEEEVERTISPNIWGDIYGGGEVGNVKKIGGTRGNADVVITGGNIGGDIYGAGLGDLDGGNLSSADIEGNTEIRIDGGSFLWDRTAGLDGNVKSLIDVTIDRETALAMIAARQKGEESAELTALKTNYSDIFDLDNNLFLKDHNIYGGGNTVSTVAGNATITVNHGLVTDAVSYFDDHDWLLSSVLKQLCTSNNSHPQFSVLGGGYGINTTITGNTLVNVQVGRNRKDDGTVVSNYYPNQAADRKTWADLYNTFSEEYTALSNDDKDEYYGGSSGANGLARYETSRLANIFRIPNHTFMNIVGGGMAGLVSGNATVNLTDQSVCQNVFGGGIGIMPESPTGSETYGQVTGTTTVNVLGGIVKGNVYGGGAGMESYYNTSTSSYVDFPAMGAVGKNTLVTIDGTPTGTIIFGKVYGGGDIANVTNSVPAEYGSEVMIKGGCVYQQVFAGGSGCLASEARDYTQLGKVTGNTLVTIKDDTTEGSESSPWLWNRVYGGGSYGSVTGSTTVEIQGGHLGYNIFGAGLGDVRTLANGTESITTSYVGTEESPNKTSTIHVTGGEWCLSQMWDIENKNWMPKKNNTLSAQFDEKNKKFLINHNMYGGGNAASKVWGSTLINMDKSLLKGNTNLGHDDAGRTATSLFASTEWKEVYNKVGSFHFCLIGGGYGEHTEVTGNTTVDVNIPASAGNEISSTFIESETDKLKDNMYTLFKSEQAVMDVIGGGYNGKVGGNTQVNISGDPFIRRVFGGSFYADIVGNTEVNITSACVDDVFAGGMMGDVKGTATLNIGADAATTNSKILICHDVYGGNDVSGQIDGQITVDIKGGKIYHNVYGAGNGNYLYALNEERQKVTAVEGYLAQGSVYDLVYEVPRRVELMPASAESSSEAARLVNINSYRPLSQFINLSIAGDESSPLVPGDGVARVKVLGKVFGGGNTATVTKLDGTRNPTVTVNIGNYVKANEVFMGADGEAMFDESTTGFLNAFKRINNIVLSDGINWANDPYNKQIPQTYLPLDLDGRQRTFPHIIDLYFQPVEMSIQPVLKWNGTVADPDTWGAATISNTTIGSFFCGGNRGNMDVTPASGGSVVDYIFPEGLTITNKIVGGCNNANFTRTDLDVVHEGGYLLGSRKTTDPMIRLTVKANMVPTESDGKYSGANVYGGCYKSGSIHGDVTVNMLSNVINGLDVDKLAASNADKNVTVGSVYGAGYGTDSYVYGDINVTLGSDEISSSQGTTTTGGDALNLSFEKNDNSQQSLDLPVEKKATVTTTTYNDTGSSVNNLYGGGELGNVIGNTIVKVLNGHVVTDVVGGSYSGNLYGSTHVLVGYPQYYTADVSGIYNLQRADKSTDNLEIKNFDGSDAIKREIKLIKGDIISPVVIDAISDYDNANSTTQASNFTVNSENPAPSNWGNISITIGEAVYGGGYALSSGYTGTGGAGTYTVKKYTDDYNVNNSMADSDPLYNVPTKGYGGNTTVLVWEDPTQPAEHITISSESADGGFYGDGHLSYAEGFRSGELKGYGYAQHKVLDYDTTDPLNPVEVNAAKVINTIQRLDLLRLTDNCLILNGARDYTINEVSTTPYSIARVGELQMVSSIDATGTLPTVPSAVKYRNYVGLTNNIHYVGAIKSNALFTDDYHNESGVKSDGISYKAKKQSIIDTWYAFTSTGKVSDDPVVPVGSTDEQRNNARDAFNLRNDATAKNLIGISSGFAFKVQNTYTADETGTEKLFYGPIDGVVEMKLILPIIDEGGGYVYADNMHDDPAYFLESTGNFVFPVPLKSPGVKDKSHVVVDDCLLTNFNDLEGTVKIAHDAVGSFERNAQQSEVHYWFLTGSHYVYNLHITGYTYDSSTTPTYFNADTSDGLTVLEGATNDLVITKIKWNHHHKDNGDLDATYNAACDIENASGYTLRLSASVAKNGAGEPVTVYDETEGKSMYKDIQRNADLDNGTKKPGDDGYTTQSLSYTGVIPTFTSPLLALQLKDNVDNSGPGYFEQHLSKPDTVKIELASGAGYEKTYTINLIINYVKGPSYTGNIRVANCALPGEFVRINKNDLIIDSDESFAQNGEFLRIGKLNGDGTGLVEGAYMTYDTSGEATSETLKGKVYSDPAGQYILIPAYYFMDGYGVQYVFTCNNMSDNAGNPAPFAVDLDPRNILEVHNYHHMKPRGTFDVDLHLPEAITRAQAEPTTFPQPRIYIKDYEDLQAMQAWVDTVGVNAGYNKVNYDGVERTIPQKGQYAQFFLQNDITVQQHTPLADKYYKSIEDFGGVFHGDGHSITGIDTNLFDNLTSTGQVYNLGLETGTIAGEVETGGAVRNSYEYGNLRAYNIDGTTTDYDNPEEFNNGTVAYNLNQYYLEARKYLIENSITPNDLTAAQSSNLADQTAVEYLKDYYANGDYQYARRSTEGSEYLRTDDNPHYTVDVQTGFDTYETFHNTAHPVDEARAVDKTKQGDYLPLFNAAKNDAAATTTVVKNDYIFFGQDLQATPEAHPSTIASHEVANMTNRVYRASGFYQSKVDKGFHFNASGDANRIITYVHDARTTAIDFTGKRDRENAASIPSAGLLNVANSQKIYYAPALDLPSEYYGMRMDNGVTQNLLVYTDSHTGDDNTIAKVAATTLNYNDDTEEYNIKGHHVVGTGTPIDTYTAAKMHLVDKEDFNAPVQFTATKAWYVRDPGDETGYVNEAGKAWSSVSLPFTVETATLSEGIDRHKDNFNNGDIGTQTDITYFYGSDAKAIDDKAHTILNHEFWLRNMTAVATSAGVMKATFKRPEYSIDGKTQNSDAVNESNRSFAAYKPFIVSFPGSKFYEFNMTGQTITFGADNATVAITDDNVSANATHVGDYYHYGAYLNNSGETGAYAIKVGGGGDKFENSAAVYPFRSYITTSDTPLAGNSNSMDIDFNVQSSMFNADYILIGDDSSQKLEDVLDGDIERDPDGGVTTEQGLRVYGVGQRIVVISDFATTLPVYTATGALVRVLDVRPGTATYSGFKQGVYIVDRKKIRLR